MLLRLFAVVWALVATGFAAMALILLMDSVLPHPPRRSARWLRERAHRVRRLVRARRHHHAPGPAEAPDPFEALLLQTRLASVSTHIRELRAVESAARAHKLVAAQAAYDDLLLEACRIAELQSVRGPYDDDARWQVEQQLAERGWTW